MADGKVLTGFSLPYVAKYAYSQGTVSYTLGQKLARGVDVTISPEASEDNIFYADNIQAENANGQLTGGTLSLTVDGLLTAAEALIMGLPTASSNWSVYDDDQAVPDVGVGFIARYMSGGTTYYTAIVLPRVQFKQIETSASTQEEEIDWQTQALEATIKRAEDSKRSWKYVSTDQTSESAAEALIKSKLGISGS